MKWFGVTVLVTTLLLLLTNVSLIDMSEQNTILTIYSAVGSFIFGFWYAWEKSKKPIIKASCLRVEYIPGTVVTLDKDFQNSSKVIVIKQTPDRLFTTVEGFPKTKENVTYTWEVMTVRLSK